MAIHTLVTAVKAGGSADSNTVALAANELQTAGTSGDFFVHFSASQIAPLLNAADAKVICIGPEISNDSPAFKMEASSDFDDTPSPDQTFPATESKLDFFTASLRDKWAEELNSGRWLFRKVYFNIAELHPLLAEGNGLFFRPVVVNMESEIGQNRKFHTLLAYTGSSNIPIDGMASALPCPPHCGNGDYKRRFSAILPA